ncbi:MAG: enoyl-[acyl-carrier-protein] reductase FabK [Christensenellales bacterium]|jgi:enoyl-[acyl-carrier protein] reductase II
MHNSPVASLLGIEYPILQGGMAWIADGALAAAVSEAGGLGLIAAGSAPAEYVRGEIRRARARTDKPFGVNIMLMSPYAEDVARVACEERVRVVTTGAGNPAKYMPAFRESGIPVIPVVASVAMAKLMTRVGASAIIAEGGEGGGHVGELTTMTLVPLVADATHLPVIAAGGIADGRGFAAAILLGASGIQMGTRFLTAVECPAHSNYKQKVLKANDLSSVVTGKRLGHPVRCLKNAFTRDYLRAEYGGASDAELDQRGAGALKLAAVDGDTDAGCVLAGQIAAMVKKEETCREIIEDMMRGVERAWEGAAAWRK